MQGEQDGGAPLSCSPMIKGRSIMSKLTIRSITKDYPGCRALDNVSVEFESGKVNALLCKNCSGKSTLVKSICGAIQPTLGEMFLDGEPLKFSGPAEAYKRGIAVVYQEMSLIPWLTVTENIFLGRMPKKGSRIDWKKAHEDAAALLKIMRVDINPREYVARIPLWQCQVVEITKAMSFNPRVLMLDEPTSSLAANEVDCLFDVINELKKQDLIILYISHKMHEIPRISDTITVLRDGKLIGKVPTSEIDQRGIIHMMFGDTKIESRPEDLKPGSDVVMQVKNLCRKGKFNNVSFELRRGEVLGIAGMLGSGRTELLKSIFGADPLDSGEVWIEGKKAPRKPSPISMKKLGMALTPEDRKLEGLILKHSIRDNLCYASMDRTSNGWVENHRAREAADKQVRDLEIKVPDIENAVSSLSGGNQQKVVVGNWLNTKPKIMMYDEPSRGIDVSAKQQIFEIMWEQARRGISSIFVSSELEELISVCNRILIMNKGRIVGEVNPDELTIEELYTLAMQEG